MKFSHSYWQLLPIGILMLFTQVLSAQTYCNARGTSPWEQWIERVGVSNSTSTTNYPRTLKEGYGNFTGATVAILVRNTNNTASISPNSSWLADPRNANLFWRVWIDLNADGDFVDAGEQVVSQQIRMAGGNFANNTANFTLPTTARLGVTRMRVAMKHGAYAVPCETFERGEVEDYSVNITEGGATRSDNTQLKITSITGSNRTEPNALMPLGITIRNYGTLPSAPDSVYLARYVRTSPINNFYLANIFSLNKVAVPAIQPNQSVTITGNFRMPSVLSYDIMSKLDSSLIDVVEPYMVLKSKIDTLFGSSAGTPPSLDSVRRIGYYFPILPASTTDLVLSGSQITTTWDSISRSVSVRLRVVNNGSVAAKNISVRLNNAFHYGSGYNLPAIIDFTKTSGVGSTNMSFYAPANMGRDEVGYRLWSWNLTEIPAGATVEATFSGTVTTNWYLPQSDANSYKNITIKPLIYYADIQDNNKANDSIVGGLTFRFVPTNAGRTDNTQLKITNITGSNRTEPNALMPLSVTIRNNGTLPSAPDSVYLATFRRTDALYDAYRIAEYSSTKVRVPSIQPNQSLTVTGSFLIPSKLYQDVTGKFDSTIIEVFEPNMVLNSKIMNIGSFAQLTLDSVKRVGYYFPVVPSRIADLALSGTQTTTTWDSLNRTIEIRLRITNNGTSAAKNIYVRLNSNLYNGQAYNYTNIDNFVKISGVGDIFNQYQHLPSIGSRSNYYNISSWGISELAAGATQEVVFRATINTPTTNPQSDINFYKNISIKPLLYYADVQDNNKANDSIAGGFTFRFVPPTNTQKPDLILSSLNLVTTSVQQGGILNYRVDIRNIGLAATSSNFTVKAYISTDNVLSSDDIQNGTIPTANFAAGFVVLQAAGSSTIGQSLPIGRYYLILKVDADNQITESNEANNVIVSAAQFNVTNANNVADLAISLTSNPTTIIRPYTISTLRVVVKNNGNQSFTNIKVKLPFGGRVVTGGIATPSVGIWEEWCAGGTQCFTWSIPSIAIGATATLDIPVFVGVLNPSFTLTASLVASSPTDAVTSNNASNITIGTNISNINNIQAITVQKPTQLIPVVVQQIFPNPTDGETTILVESLENQEVEFQISNPIGEIVLREKHNVREGRNRVELNIWELPTGIYFIQTDLGKGKNAPTKIIKM